jgi:hypothetical protein
MSTELILNQAFIDNLNIQIDAKADQATTYTKTETDSAIATQVSQLVNEAPETLNTLNELAQALGDDPNFATTVMDLIGTKAPTNNPSFTGTVSGITKAMVGLGNVDNTSDASKPISTATQTALNLKADQATTYTKTEVDNTIVGWSSGLPSDGYHYIDTGSDALVIRTPSGAISANFLGNAGGASYDGKVLVYNGLEVIGSLTTTDILVGSTNSVFTNKILGNGDPQITVDDNLKVTGDIACDSFVVAAGGLLAEGVNVKNELDSLSTSLAGKESAFVAISPLQKVINISTGDIELRSLSPFWGAGRVNGAVSTPTILASKGRVGFSVSRRNNNIGQFTITFAGDHPDGANYVIDAIQQGKGTIKVQETSG